MDFNTLNNKEPFLSKPQNKWSMGKYFRQIKELYKKDPSFVMTSSSQKLEWLPFYESQGLIMNKIGFARFSLKNGLPYDGIIATENLLPNELIIKIPRNLLLNSRHAYLSEIKEIYKENPENFWNYDEIDQDLVLIVFILYEFQKGKNSEFYHLINTLPRDQDVLPFWSVEDIESFEDPSLRRKVLNRKKLIHDEYESLKELINKYPNLIKPEIFSYENFSWIYALLLNRSFDACNFSYVQMMPIAEYLNHECTGTSFEQVNTGNNVIYNKVEEEEIEGFTTSDVSSKNWESDYEEDFFGFSEEANEKTVIDSIGKENNGEKSDLNEKSSLEYKEMDKNLMDYNEKDKNSMDCKEKDKNLIDSKEYENKMIEYKENDNSLYDYKEENDEKCNNYKEINEELSKIKAWFDENLSYIDLFSMIYVYKSLNHTRSLYKCIKTPEIKGALDAINVNNSEFKDNLEKFSKETLRNENYKEYCDSLSFKDPDLAWEKPPNDLFMKNFEEEAFEAVEFRSSPAEFYSKDSQVFYCYGRKSNRSLASNYGMCVEYNKYGTVYLKVDYRDYIEFDESLKDLIKCQKINRYKRIKLRYTKFNKEILSFFKLLFFDFKKNNIREIFEPRDLKLEILAVEAVIELLDKSYQSKFTMKENERILYDKNTNYHQYFAAIYRLEKQRIIKLNRNLFEIYREILLRIKQGMSYLESCERVELLENEEEFNRNRYLLYPQLKLLCFNHNY